MTPGQLLSIQAYGPDCLFIATSIAGILMVLVIIAIVATASLCFIASSWSRRKSKPNI